MTVTNTVRLPAVREIPPMLRPGHARLDLVISRAALRGRRYVRVDELGDGDRRLIDN
jgi:hypothetical protein